MTAMLKYTRFDAIVSVSFRSFYSSDMIRGSEEEFWYYHYRTFSVEKDLLFQGVSNGALLLT